MKESSEGIINFGIHPMLQEGRCLYGFYDSNKNHFIIDHNRDFYGAFVYGVSPEAAEELLNYQERIFRKSGSQG